MGPVLLLAPDKVVDNLAKLLPCSLVFSSHDFSFCPVRIYCRNIACFLFLSVTLVSTITSHGGNESHTSRNMNMVMLLLQ